MEETMTKTDLYYHHEGEFNIIGDIAGQYKTLMALLAKMPKTATPLSLGDMIDRGPESKKVLDFFMQEGNLAIKGNHDHFLESAYRGGYYRDGIWEYNGGGSTLENFGIDDSIYMHDYSKIPEKYVKFIESLPLYMYLDEYNKDGLQGFVSHASKNPNLTVEQCADIGKNINSRRADTSFLWNRGATGRFPNYYQFCGHNSHWGLEAQSDKEGEYGKCIDTSSSKILTAVHWPSMVIYQQEYIDE